MATWLSHYPLDLVANKMMADIVLTSTSNSTDSSSSSSTSKTIRKKIGMMDQFRIIYKQYGWKGYFRGIGPCLLRAFPVNAAIFVSYEFCMGNI